MKVNDQIKTKEVRIVTEGGMNLGMFTLANAMTKADESFLDLVEVTPGVCKLMDFGKWKYQQAKRPKQPKPPRLKEISINTTIGENDLLIKISRAKKFMEKGHPVRIVINQKARNVSTVVTSVYERIVEVLGKPTDVSRENRKVFMRYE